MHAVWLGLKTLLAHYPAFKVRSLAFQGTIARLSPTVRTACQQGAFEIGAGALSDVSGAVFGQSDRISSAMD